MNSHPRIWITWETHRRSRGLSAALGAKLFEINVRGGRLTRYIRSTLTTLRILFSARGSKVFVQSPSIVLANVAATFGKLAGAMVIVDAHNGGIDPLDGSSSLLTRLARRALRKSDLVIVTNQALAQRVERMGAKAFVLCDPIPDFPAAPAHEPENAQPSAQRVVAICTWAADEPYPELIRAAALLPRDCELAITGRPRLPANQSAGLPPNIRTTGFVSDAEYIELLRTADVVVDLTTRENCLLCGAYEAVSLHKPLVVSDTMALRELLGDAAIYCTNEAESIASAILTALGRRQVLEQSARQRDTALRALCSQRCTELVALLEAF
jgi:glycosyltransferase involved in cell wall biosynthesis